MIKKLAIRKFIKEIDKDIKVKFQKWDLECDIFEETIYIGKPYDKENDRRFGEFVKELNPACDAPIFLLSILHEVGHIMTYDEDALSEKDFLYATIDLKLQSGADEEECVKEYFRIPLELEATKWAIDFAMNNPQIINKYKWITSL